MVISEDSDLVPFGCERVFFKMDKVGNGILIDKKDLGETLPFNMGFTHDRFRWMCILSGEENRTSRGLIPQYIIYDTLYLTRAFKFI